MNYKPRNSNEYIVHYLNFSMAMSWQSDVTMAMDWSVLASGASVGSGYWSTLIADPFPRYL